LLDIVHLSLQGALPALYPAPVVIERIDEQIDLIHYYQFDFAFLATLQ